MTELTEKGIVALINEFEDGQMEQENIPGFFCYLLNTGYIHHLQGSYGRQAERLLNSGAIVRYDDQFVEGQHDKILVKAS